MFINFEIKIFPVNFNIYIAPKSFETTLPDCPFNNPIYADGNPALVNEGDLITIDADKRLLQVHLTDEELAERRKNWQPPQARYSRGVIAKYAKLVSSSSVGAVTD
jgi:Dehydratase family